MLARIAGAALGLTIAACGVAAAAAPEAGPSVLDRLQAALDGHLAERRALEHLTGLGLHLSLGEPGPVIELHAGTVSEAPGAAPISGDTLFQIGSNTKAFTAATILKLEERGALAVDQTVGDWLPEYPAWGGVTIRRLLDMTSAIPNYSETVRMGEIEAADPQHQWTPEALVAAAYPAAGNELPVHEGWDYSNTNYVLAGMIAERAGKAPFAELLHELVLAPAGLRDTHYAPGPYPQAVLARTASGYFFNAACLDYQPPGCKESPLASLMGKDMRDNNLSWALGAGGIVASLRDVSRWVRVLLGGRLLAPAQQAELTKLVSTKTGRPIDTTTEGDPRGFGLGVAQMFHPGMGRAWFYEGETLGYRVVFFYLPEEDLVVTLGANSQPPADQDKMGALAVQVHGILKATGTVPCCRAAAAP